MRLAPLPKLISGIIGIIGIFGIIGIIGIIGVFGIIGVYLILSFSTHRFYVAIPTAYGLRSQT